MKNWKKYASLLLALVLCLSLTACSGDKDTAPETIKSLAMNDTEEELEQLPDISGYTGYWKVENEPLYYIINDSCEWPA